MTPGRLSWRYVQLDGDPVVDPELAVEIVISHPDWERLRIPQEQLENVAGESNLWNTLLSLLPMLTDPR